MLRFRLLQKRLLVKNLPAGFTEAEFKEVLKNPIEVTLPKWNYEYKRFGFAVVEDEQADFFLNNPVTFKGNSLSFEIALPKETRPSLSVYIRNLPDNVESEDLKSIFPEFNDCVIKSSKQPGFGNFAILGFSDLETSAKAFALNGTEFQGKPLVVQYTINSHRNDGKRDE